MRNEVEPTNFRVGIAGSRSLSPRPWLAVVAVLAAAHAGCGGGADGLDDPGTMQCGPGTVAVGSTCVPSTADGGQDGDASIDDPATGDAGASDGGPDVGGEASSPDADPADGPAGPPDDPCPDVTPPAVFINCSDTCGPKSPECDALACSAAGALGLTSVTELPAVIRTPSHPGQHAKCAADCPSDRPTAYSVPIDLYFQYVDGKLCEDLWLGAGTNAPWEVAFEFPNALLEDKCTSFHATPPTCEAGSGCGHKALFISTRDPDAPARNVLLARFPPWTSCP